MLSILTSISYLAASGAWWLRRPKLGWTLLSLAIFLHLFLLSRTWVTEQEGYLSLFFLLSCSALVLSGFAAIWLRHIKLREASILLLIAAAALTLFSETPSSIERAAHDWSWTLQLHVVSSIAAYSLLFLGALLSVAVLLQHRALRAKPMRKASAFVPALEPSSQALLATLHSGLALLSIAVVTGLFFLTDWSNQNLIHKILLTSLAWVVFAAVVIGRRIFDWQGPTIARWTLVGFSVLLVGYLGSRIVLEFLLGRPWG